MDEDAHDILKCAADIVAAYAGNNVVSAAELPNLIRTVHGALNVLAGSPSLEPAAAAKPAVTIRKSITPDYVVCLEDGKKLKMLKRYLRSRYGLSPEDYRSKWGLPRDYPMVAPNYAAQRSAFAKKIGLGRTPAKARRRKK
ncbi:MAG: MucR family transcriptional regulator [Rhizomicrobium sp.]|jgi:predicted transcriptional regulator